MSVSPVNLQQTKGLSELWRRLRFVLLAVVIYRIGTHIPIPGIDPDKLASLFEQNRGTLQDLFNMFSGGALERMSNMALNIMPYITSSIIMSLMEGTNPSLKRRFREEGEEGRRLRTAYVRYGTVLLALLQASGLALGLQNQGLALESGFTFQVIAVISLVTGTVFLMWLGELVTEKGIGNGISIIIFSSIVSGLPRAIGQAFEGARQGDINLLMLLSIAFVAIVAVVVVRIFSSNITYIKKSSLLVLTNSFR